MMTAMKNIMIVSVLIMLQMQSVYASREALCFVGPEISWLRFVTRNARLCHADDVVLEALQYMNLRGCVHLGLNATCARRIEVEKMQNSKVSDFLHHREEVCDAVADFLPLFNEAYKESQEAFAELAERERCNPFLSAKADNAKEGSNLRQSIIKCTCMQDAYNGVLIFLDNSKDLGDRQEQYIAAVLNTSSDSPELTDATLRALKRYRASIKKRAELRKYYLRVKALYKRELSFSNELDIVQNILKEEGKKSVKVF